MTAAANKLGLDISLVLLHGEKGPCSRATRCSTGSWAPTSRVVDLDDLEPSSPSSTRSRRGARGRAAAPTSWPRWASQLGSAPSATSLPPRARSSRLRSPRARGRPPLLSGANMTPAGLVIGLKASAGRPGSIAIPIRWREDRVPVDIARSPRHRPPPRLDAPLTARRRQHDEYIGERYGVVTDACREALKLVAGTEGLLLDPVYTGKAMAGLIDDVRQGRLGAASGWCSSTRAARRPCSRMRRIWGWGEQETPATRWPQGRHPPGTSRPSLPGGECRSVAWTRRHDICSRQPPRVPSSSRQTLDLRSAGSGMRRAPWNTHPIAFQAWFGRGNGDRVLRQAPVPDWNNQQCISHLDDSTARP